MTSRVLSSNPDLLPNLKGEEYYIEIKDGDYNIEALLTIKTENKEVLQKLLNLIQVGFKEK